MKTLFAAAAVLSLALVSPALADGTAEAFAANTVVATGANGAVLKFHFNSGGVYTMKAGDQAVSGVWTVEAGQFCIQPQGGERSCSPHDPNRKVGDTWQVSGADGVQYSVQLVAGR
jgi:hypothetical protein